MTQTEGSIWADYFLENDIVALSQTEHAGRVFEWKHHLASSNIAALIVNGSRMRPVVSVPDVRDEIDARHNR